MAKKREPLPLPRFSSHKPVLRPKDLRYNPCNDLIFPSIIQAADHIAAPLGNYYLYYAPHDAPGGICLAYADTLEGPWTEYQNNPILARNWPPHHDVSHISSPHLLWMEELACYHLYYHGENNTTRFASTTDGIHFAYGGIAVCTEMYEGISESSYARVFRCDNPAQKEARYGMFFMGNNGGTRRIYAAWSPDGRTFTAQKKPLIDPPPGTGVNQVGAPWYFPWEGRNVILFHGDKTDPTVTTLENLTTDIFATDVGSTFTSQDHLGLFFSRAQTGPDLMRVCDPCLVSDEAGTKWLFFAAGPRLGQFLACARENS